ncbi:MAG: homoserine dehydrogenase, partial [Gammaproteobacteria bacterium]
MDPIKIGLLGLGTVGGGTVSVLTRNMDEITRRAGREIVISHAAAKEYDAAIEGLDKIGKITDDAFGVVNDPEVEIVIELIGGYTLAKELVLKAIENGKHVVTANKALIALHGNEIFSAAQAKGVTVAFEAAVAGGIPIIKAMREGLAANQIQWAAGIINGTGNFILSEMRDKGRDFDDVLQEAQALGYAEADPTFDVEGIDAAHKLTIIASIAFGIPLQFEKTYTEGITHIEQQDVKYAGELGYRIKHLGITRKTEKGIEMRVHPTLIPERRLIANVDGVMNAVLVYGDAVGPTLYYGAGAGAQPTASAVVADVVDIVRALTSDPENRVPHLAFQPDAMSDIQVIDIEEIETAYYLRLSAVDRPGVLADITAIFGDSNISIKAIIQKQAIEGSSQIPVIFLTQRVLEKDMNEA